MRLAISGAVGAVILVGCAANQPTAPVEPTASAKPPNSATTLGASVTRASAQLSVMTHHGADSLSGLRVTGTCDGGKVTVDVGHAPPYLPLRRVGIPEIDRTAPLRRASLTAECLDGRFKVSRRNVSVRIGAGPLTAKPRAEQSTAVEVRVKGHAIE